MEAAAPPSITDGEFIEKYRKLCGHIAWDFVRRSQRGISQVVLTKEDAEDFASAAFLKLMHIVTKHPHRKTNKYYVQRAIENGITNAWQKRLREMGAEGDGIALRRSGLVPQDSNGDSGSERNLDPFDMLPGRDGLAGHIQVTLDYAKVSAILSELPEAERLVLELSFGLNGSATCSFERIAKKLGRTKWWAQRKYNAAILRIQSHLSSQQQISFVS